MLTNAKRAEIRKRADAATPGPWACRVRAQSSLLLRGDESAPPKERHMQGSIQIEPQADAEFIAAARLDVSALLDDIEELQALLWDVLRATRMNSHMEDVEVGLSTRITAAIGEGP